MAKKRRKKVASRGSVNNIILRSLYSGDKYGYEIIKEVEEFSEGKIKLKQPSLYSSLSRFEDKHIVSSYWGDSDIGGRRHYYQLTKEGLKYYRKEVLKEFEEDDDAQDNVDSKNVALQNDLSSATQDSTLVKTVDSKPTPSSEPELKEVVSDSIPAILNFDIVQPEEKIPDHNFVDHNTNQISIDNITPTDKINTNNEEVGVWQVLADKTKLSNRQMSSTANYKFHYNKPKKSQIVVLDKDGIYKLRDENYISRSNPSSNVIDNVITRRTNNEAVNYKNSTPYNTTTPRKELSEEEKTKRNSLFLEKFNLLTKSKMVEKKEEVQTKNVMPTEDIIDYRNKLDKFIDNTPDTNEEYLSSTPPQENNLFNYEDDVTEEGIIEDEEDKFVDFEPVEFNVKNNDRQYLDRINNDIESPRPIEIKRYETKANAILNDKSYVLINKVKLVFGIILTLLLITEITTMWFVFKNYNLIFEYDNILFISAYVITGLIAVFYILPFLINSNNHRLNNFKLRYYLPIGILTFFVVVILIYCFNALGGFEISNFKFFAVKLILPSVLAFNFVFCPIIYSFLINCKKFYD